MCSYNALSDIELATLLKESDNRAYTEIYNRYSALLYIHAYRRLRDKEEAKDVVHELFTTLWFRRTEIVLKSTLLAYLYTAIRNRVFDIISHKGVESAYIQSVQQFIDENVCITDYLLRHNELMASIEKEIAALPVKMREVFELSRKAHLSHKEIAEKLDISGQTVKTQVNNALKILRVKFGLLVFLMFLLNF